MKVLHLSRHAGCIEELEYVGSALGFDLTSIQYEDGYNIGPERAERSWLRHREAILVHDVVLTSDTAPLARIVLPHLDEFRGRVVVWICNRFDYHDEETNDCGFPDRGWYAVIRNALRHPRVTVVPYTAFEWVYARRKGVPVCDHVVRPIGARRGDPSVTAIPGDVDRASTFFIPPYHNDTHLLDLEARCRELGIRAYRGRYAGAKDLEGFRAIVHVPYAWSTLALFEQVQLGLTHVIPSAGLLSSLARQPGFFWPDLEPVEPRVRFLLNQRRRGRPIGTLLDLGLSEWYDPANAAVIRTFDSWDELPSVAEAATGDARAAEVLTFAEAHAGDVLQRWERVLELS